MTDQQIIALWAHIPVAHPGVEHSALLAFAHSLIAATKEDAGVICARYANWLDQKGEPAAAIVADECGRRIRESVCDHQAGQ